ncbi:hypothetical protein BVY10_27085 [Pseudomonas amygdali pv. morsprunorum]|nr:hypothetical protein BVY10_27085 [Pseudomonas amygdali pv. morsprunorum]
MVILLLVFILTLIITVTPSLSKPVLLMLYLRLILLLLQILQPQQHLILRLTKSAKMLKVQSKKVIAGINLRISLYLLRPVVVQLQYPV